jgi:hypothetical protein
MSRYLKQISEFNKRTQGSGIRIYKSEAPNIFSYGLIIAGA